MWLSKIAFCAERTIWYNVRGKGDLYIHDAVCEGFLRIA